MLCKKCNRKLDINDRCCLYCGEINPYNKKNIELETQKEVEMIKNELEKEDKKNNKKIKQKQEIIAKDIKYNKKVFVFLNILFSLTLFFIYFLYLFICAKQYEKLFNENYSIFFLIDYKIILFIIIIFFYIICLEKIFMKANKNWYFALIPILNIYYYFLISSSDDEYLIIKIFANFLSVNALLCLTSFFSVEIAFVTFILFNIPFFKYYDYKLGQSFNFNKYISMLFPMIAIPIIAFSKKYQY